MSEVKCPKCGAELEVEIKAAPAAEAEPAEMMGGKGPMSGPEMTKSAGQQSYLDRQLGA